MGVHNEEFERLELIAREVFGDLAKLARAMGKNSNIFNPYKRRAEIGRYILKDLQLFGINPEYIKTGKGEKFLPHFRGNLTGNNTKDYSSISEPNAEYVSEEVKKSILKLFEINVILTPTAKAGNDVLIEQTRTVSMNIKELISPTLSANQMEGIIVSGNSMKENGLKDGDIVLFKKSDTAKTGDTVVAVLNGVILIKVYEEREDGIYLVSSNPDYKPLKISEFGSFEIKGICKYNFTDIN